MAEPQLAGQTVVVLGGSAGIGLATARRARAEGANVVITGRDPERLARAAADVGATQTAHFDAADEPALQQFFDQLGQQLDGPIGHVLVAAGGPYYAPFAELDVADAMRYVSRALALPLNVARFASPRMGPGGSLTFIGGTGARQAREGTQHHRGGQRRGPRAGREPGPGGRPGPGQPDRARLRGHPAVRDPAWYRAGGAPGRTAAQPAGASGDRTVRRGRAGRAPHGQSRADRGHLRHRRRPAAAVMRNH